MSSCCLTGADTPTSDSLQVVEGALVHLSSTVCTLLKGCLYTYFQMSSCCLTGADTPTSDSLHVVEGVLVGGVLQLLVPPSGNTRRGRKVARAQTAIFNLRLQDVGMYG